MTTPPAFSCAPGSETLAAELAGLVDGTWETVPWVQDVMIQNGAIVPRELPEGASPRARTWWHAAVTTRLSPPEIRRASRSRH
jgi:hypothetical protein